VINFADQYPGEKLTVHIDRAAAVTARMPTQEECAAGYPPGAPVLVVEDGGTGGKVFPHLVALTFDDPHGQPAPDAVRDAALFVLRAIGQDLSLVHARIGDLIGAFRRSPCAVAHLAVEVREEQAAAWQCADPSVCERAARPAS
jgi:hypothetical protein